MRSCKEVSKLVSESLDRNLPFWQRVQLRMHLSLCKLCKRFERDLLHIRDAVRRDAEEALEPADDSQPKLSPEARQRIQRALERRDADLRIED